MFLTTVIFFLSSDHPHPCSVFWRWWIYHGPKNWSWWWQRAVLCIYWCLWIIWLWNWLVAFFPLCVLWIETEGVMSFVQWAAQSWTWYSRCGLISAIYKGTMTSRPAGCTIGFIWLKVHGRRCLGRVWEPYLSLLRFLSENFLFCYAKGAEL